MSTTFKEQYSSAKAVVPIARGSETKDSLLKEFSAGQRDYILHKLYPMLKKALVHFVAEAKLNNEITERAEEQISV